jgi:hypothetical protein
MLIFAASYRHLCAAGDDQYGFFTEAQPLPEIVLRVDRRIVRFTPKSGQRDVRFGSKADIQ